MLSASTSERPPNPPSRFDAARRSRRACGSARAAAPRPSALRRGVSDHRVDLLLDRRRIDAGLERRLDDEGAGELARSDAGADARHQLLLVDQPPIEPRALRAAEHARPTVRAVEIGVAPAGRVIGAIDARLRHAVLHLSRMLRSRRGIHCSARAQRRPGRDPVEVLLHQLERALRRDVAGQREHAVVRAVVGAYHSFTSSSDAASRSSMLPMVDQL